MTQPVKVVLDNELKINGGRYGVTGDVAYPVVAVVSDRGAIQSAIPVYVTTDFNRFKPSGATPMVVVDIDVVGSKIDVTDQNAIPVYVVSGSLGLPIMPTGLSAVQNGSNVVLNWIDNATNEAGYRIYRSPDGLSYSLIDTITANSNNYTDAAPGLQTWYYKIAPYNSIGESLSSAVSIVLTYLNVLLTTQPDSLISHYGFGDSSGVLAVNNVAQSMTGNISFNGGMELSGHSNSPTFAGWIERVGGGTIAAETTIVHSGSRAAKLTEGASTWIYQSIIVKPGESYNYSFWTRGDGANAGKYGIKNNSDNNFLVALGTSTGVSGAVYTEVAGTINIPSTCTEIIVYLQAPTGGGNFAYFDDFALTGTVNLDGTYSPSGVTLGVTGVGDGNTAASFTGVSTYVGWNGILFDSLFNPDLGSAIAWGKMSAAEWADATELRYLFHQKSANNATSYVVFGKHTDAKTLFWRRRTGVGTSDNEQKYVFGSVPDDQWFVMGYTWDISTPRLRGYLYVPGVLAWTKVFDIAGADMNSLTSLDFSDYNACIMAGSSAPGGANAQEWMGDGAHVAIWSNIVLSDAEMQSVMTPS